MKKLFLLIGLIVLLSPLVYAGEYDGEYKNGKRHGQGTYTWADGRIKRGEWKNGELVKETTPEEENTIAEAKKKYDGVYENITRDCDSSGSINTSFQLLDIFIQNDKANFIPIENDYGVGQDAIGRVRKIKIINIIDLHQ